MRPLIKKEKAQIHESRAEMLERVKRSTVTIDTWQHPTRRFPNTEERDTKPQFAGHGSGYVIEGGKIMTNAHVAVYALVGAVYSIKFASGEEVPAQVVYIDRKNDSAILVPTVDIELPEPLTFANPDSLRVADTVWAVGTPIGEGYEQSVLTGTVSGLPETPKNEDSNAIIDWRSESLKVAITAVKGMSGGPLVNEKGEIVGMTSGGEKAIAGGSDSIKLFVPGQEVKILAEYADFFIGIQRMTDVIERWRCSNELPEHIAGKGSVALSSAIISELSRVFEVCPDKRSFPESKRIEIQKMLLENKSIQSMIRTSISGGVSIKREDLITINEQWNTYFGVQMFPQPAELAQVESEELAA